MFFLTFATLCAAWPLLWHCWHTRSEVGQAWFGLGSGSGSGHNSLNSCFFGLEKFTIQAGLLSGLGFTKQMKIVELKSVLCNKPDPPLHLLRNPQFYFRIVCCWLRTEERLRKKSADIILGSTCHWLKKSYRSQILPRKHPSQISSLREPGWPDEFAKKSPKM
jgi:hypothetical protein